MPTLPNMSLITPTPGGDSGAWDDKINAAFALVDAHDHTSGKGVQVPTTGININADLPMGGYGFTSLGKISFSTIAAPSSGQRNLFVNSADNELYWRSNAGVNVKLTSGASINTSLVGGIGGDYSTVGAELAFDDANKRYTFKDQSSPSKKWARIASGPVRIYEYNTTESVYVEHAVNAALAASYTVTWPSALPAAQALVQISATGGITFSSTFAGALTAADFNHQGRTTHIPGAASVDANGTVHTRKLSAIGAQVGWQIAANTGKIVFPLRMDSGDIITGYSLRVTKNTDATNTITARLYRTDSDTNTETPLGAGNSSAAAAPGAIALAETGLSITVGNADDEQFYLVFSPGGGATPAADVVYSLLVDYKRA